MSERRSQALGAAEWATHLEVLNSDETFHSHTRGTYRASLRVALQDYDTRCMDLARDTGQTVNRYPATVLGLEPDIRIEILDILGRIDRERCWMPHVGQGLPEEPEPVLIVEIRTRLLAAIGASPSRPPGSSMIDDLGLPAPMRFENLKKAVEELLNHYDCYPESLVKDICQGLAAALAASKE